jgi:hypothetical protein
VLKILNDVTVISLPDFHSTVYTAACQGIAIWTKLHGPDTRCVSGKRFVEFKNAAIYLAGLFDKLKIGCHRDEN